MTEKLTGGDAAPLQAYRLARFAGGRWGLADAARVRLVGLTTG